MCTRTNARTSDQDGGEDAVVGGSSVRRRERRRRRGRNEASIRGEPVIEILLHRFRHECEDAVRLRRPRRRRCTLDATKDAGRNGRKCRAATADAAAAADDAAVTV